VRALNGGGNISGYQYFDRSLQETATYTVAQAKASCQSSVAPGELESTIKLVNKRLCSEPVLRDLLSRHGLNATATLADKFWIDRSEGVGYITTRPVSHNTSWQGRPAVPGENSIFPYCCADRAPSPSGLTTLTLDALALTSKQLGNAVSLLPQGAGDWASLVKSAHHDDTYSLEVSVENIVGLGSSKRSAVFRVDPIPPFSFSGLQISFASAEHRPMSVSVGSSALQSDHRAGTIPFTAGINVSWAVSDFDSGLDRFVLEAQLIEQFPSTFTASTTSAAAPGTSTRPFSSTGTLPPTAAPSSPSSTSSSLFLNASASRIWLLPNLTFGGQDLHGRFVALIGTANDIAGNVAVESRVVRVDLSPPQPVPFDPVPAVYHCAGQSIVVNGVEGDPIQVSVSLDSCSFSADVSQANCIAMLDRLYYGGLDKKGGKYSILFPEQNNGKPAVTFNATSYRDFSHYPTMARVGITFLCSIPSYTFNVSRCYTTSSEVADVMTSSDCVGGGASLASNLFSVEGFNGTHYTWANAYNWTVPPSIAQCSVGLSSAQTSEIDPACLPSTSVYASLLSVITPLGLTGRHVMYPFLSRQAQTVLEAGHVNGGLAANLNGTIQLQAIQFQFRFDSTSLELQQLGYDDLAADPASAGPPRLAFLHSRSGGRQVWLPVGTGLMGDLPVVLDASTDDLQFRLIGVSDRESSLLPASDQVLFTYAFKSLPEYWPPEMFVRLHPASFSRPQLKALLYQV
jgi:hypothetical protein